MRLGIISDIHSNLPAFKSVLSDIRKNDVDYVLCLGDVVGYGASPNRVIEILERSPLKKIAVRGNHDEAVVTGDLMKLDRNASEAAHWTIKNIRNENLRFLENLEKHQAVEIDGQKFFLVHGSPRDPLNEYVKKGVPNETLDEFFEDTGADVLLMGHTHIPFHRSTKGGLVLNPGSVGQPRDRDRRASYALLDTRENKREIRRISYNIEKAIQEIKKTGIPERVAYRLNYGQ